MAENPLLPDAELRALLAQTKQCVVTAKKAAGLRTGGSVSRKNEQPRLRAREALLAATTMQLRPGDLLLAEHGDIQVAALAPASPDAVPTVALYPDALARGSNLLLAAAMAATLRASGRDHLALTYLTHGTAQAQWAAALTWAQEQLLPLLVVVADPRGAKAFTAANHDTQREIFEWAAVRRTASRLGLPVLTADGEDAVAVYRVMQESVLRARSWGGPALMWMMLPSSKEAAAPRPRALTPLGRLQSYLRSRKIAF